MKQLKPLNLWVVLLLTVLATAATAATTIQFRRGPAARLPAQAKMGEPLMTTDTLQVYIGTSSSRMALRTQPQHDTFSSATQAKLDAKQNSITAGTDYLAPAGNGSSLTGLTKTQVGLANVDNTSDASKPVSTAQQTALNLKANLDSPTFTGVVTSSGGVVVPQGITAQSTSFFEASANGANKITLTVPSSIAADHTYTLGETGLLLDGSAISGGGTWGSITGTLSAQTDLNTALGLKEDAANKSTSTALGASNTLYPTQGAVKSYVDTAIAGVNAASGYVAVPTYSDQSCTAGQYAKGGGYAYFCGPGSAWDRVALAGWSNPSPVAPTLSSATIAANGATLTLAMSASTSVGAGGSGGLDVDCPSITNDAATYVSGSGTSSLVYSLATAVLQSDSTNCNIDYTQPGNGLEGTTGGADVATIASAAVTNNSTQSAVTYLINQNFEGTGYDNGETWTETGTVYADYTTSPLRGSQSLSLSTADYANTRVDFTAQNSIYFHFLFSISADTTSQFFEIMNTGTSFVSVKYIAGGFLRIGGTSQNATVSGVAINTPYHVWGRYTNDGTLDIRYNTTTDYDTATAASTTTNSDTAQANRVRFISDTTANKKIDQFIVSPTAIGDVAE